MVDRLPQLVTSIFARREGGEGPPAEPTACPQCGADLESQPDFKRYRVCGRCGHHFRISARQRLSLLLDPGSFRETDRWLASADPLRFTDRVSYHERLAEAQHRTGLTEAVITGTGTIDGQPVTIAVMEFEFLGGSMGSVVGEKVARTFERALRRKQPAITVAASGGARMQEGMLSLMQMAKTAAAARRLHQARIPYISVLTDPTTGGVLASFASLGDVVLAEPGALIGFSGPRVIEQTIGQKLPAEAQRAEFMLAHGQLDLVVPRPRLRATLAEMLRLLTARAGFTPAARRWAEEPLKAEAESAWDVVQRARDVRRPTARTLIGYLLSSFIELHGDRLYADDPAVVAGVGEFAGRAVAVIGQERTGRDGRAMPEGYRKARRIMALAGKFGLPLITLIDTPGAYPGLESEERGLAGAIAECLGTLSELPVPTVAVVVGEGASGGALALALADRIIMLENATFEVIAPEGAAAILYRDASRAAEVAQALRLTARDLKELGLIDRVVSEPPGGAHVDPAATARELRSAILAELSDLERQPVGRLLKARYEKFRRVGQYENYLRTTLGRMLGRRLGR
ncbi:MAG: acetyl-CoA carboxylase carboxyl transferase subunit beta [Chloroflexota bacterium]